MGKHLNPAGASVVVAADGSVTVAVGTTEIGQGMITVLSQITAEALGCPVELVRVVEADTSRVPDSGPTVASRTTVMSGNAIRDAAAKIRAAMEPGHRGQRPALARGGRALRHRSRSAWPPTAGRCRPTTTFDLETGQGEAYICYSFSANVVEVEVDTETGETRVHAGLVGPRRRPRHQPHDRRGAGRGRGRAGPRLRAGRGARAARRPHPERPVLDLHHPHHPGHAGDQGHPRRARVPVGPVRGQGPGRDADHRRGPGGDGRHPSRDGRAPRPRSRPRPSACGRPCAQRSVERVAETRRRRPLRQPQGVPAQGAHRPAPARRAARRPPPHRGQGRLRQGRVRRLHRARGRPGRGLLPDDGLPGRRRGDRDDRRAGRRRPLHPLQDAVHRGGRRAVRDLHPGHDPGRQGRSLDEQPEADARTRCARAWPATSAAARATRRSSPPSRAPPPSPRLDQAAPLHGARRGPALLPAALAGGGARDPGRSARTRCGRWPAAPTSWCEAKDGAANRAALFDLTARPRDARASRRRTATCGSAPRPPTRR